MTSIARTLKDFEINIQQASTSKGLVSCFDLNCIQYVCKLKGGVFSELNIIWTCTELVYPGCGIWIMVQDERLMMSSLNMVDNPLSFFLCPPELCFAGQEDKGFRFYRDLGLGQGGFGTKGLGTGLDKIKNKVEGTILRNFMPKSLSANATKIDPFFLLRQ